MFVLTVPSDTAEDFDKINEKGRLDEIVKELHNAFSTVGFVYLKNHGIDQKLVTLSLKFTL